MARIILILGFLALASCASNKKKDEMAMTIAMKDNLFASQNKFENIIKTNDPLFLSTRKNSCIKNWGKEVFKLKKQLRKASKDHERVRIWFNLGNCYNYVKQMEQSFYYYDLVLGSGTKDTKLLSVIYYNIGQIYERSGQLTLAYSYYENANKNDDPSSLSIFKLALLEFKQGEYRLSIKYLNQLAKRFPKSEIVRFLLGVNYFHLNEKESIKNKVLPRLVEKSESRILLNMALDLNNKKLSKSLVGDLENLEVDFKLHRDFKEFLLGKLGK